MHHNRSAEAIVKKFADAPHLRMTEDEAAILLSLEERPLTVNKLLLVYFSQRGNFDRALNIAEAVFFVEPSAEAAKNVTLLLRRCKRFDDGIAFAKANEGLFDPIVFHDVVGRVYLFFSHQLLPVFFGEPFRVVSHHLFTV